MIPFHIGHKRYTIQFIDNPLGDHQGLCELDKNLIYVAQDRPSGDVANTIIHECLHAIFDAYGLDYEDEEEERLVTAIANGISQAIQRNPALIKKLAVLLNDQPEY